MEFSLRVDSNNPLGNDGAELLFYAIGNDAPHSTIVHLLDMGAQAHRIAVPEPPRKTGPFTHLHPEHPSRKPFRPIDVMSLKASCFDNRFLMMDHRLSGQCRTCTLL